MDTATNLQLAGLANDARVRIGKWQRPPTCTIEDDRLTWDGGKPINTAPTVTGGSLIVRFAELHDPTSAGQVRSTTALRSFADRYGPLHLCDQHRLPATHLTDRTHRMAVIDIARSQGLSDDEIRDAAELDKHDQPLMGFKDGEEAVRQRCNERITDWSYWSCGASLALRLAGAANSPSKDASEILDLIDAWSEEHPDRLLPLSSLPIGPDRVRPTEQTVQSAASILIDSWLAWGGVTQRLAWDGGVPAFRLHASTLFGVLAVEVATMAISDSIRTDSGRRVIEFCSTCGIPVERQRRTQKGKRTRCSDPACQRQASTDSKRRTRATKTSG